MFANLFNLRFKPFPGSALPLSDSDAFVEEGETRRICERLSRDGVAWFGANHIYIPYPIVDNTSTAPTPGIHLWPRYAQTPRINERRETLTDPAALTYTIYTPCTSTPFRSSLHHGSWPFPTFPSHHLQPDPFPLLTALSPASIPTFWRILVHCTALLAFDSNIVLYAIHLHPHPFQRRGCGTRHSQPRVVLILPGLTTPVRPCIYL